MTMRDTPVSLHVAAPFDIRALCADAAVMATALAVAVLFAISPVTLEHFGVAYITSGGGLLSKVHPATFLVMLALALRCLAAPHPLRTGWRLVSQDSGAVVLLAATLLAAIFAATVSKTPVTPLIDTFALPVLLFLLLRGLDPTLARWLALLVACIFAINAAMALIEFLRGTHLVTLPIADGVSSDPTRGDAVFDWRADISQDWRATALFGHPLVNGLIVGCFILCLLARGSRWLPAPLKISLLLLQSASMFAFGARASLILTGIFAIYLVVRQGGDSLAKGARFTPRATALVLVAIAAAVAGTALLIETGFFDRTVERFVSDSGSAETRMTMLALFQPFSWSDLVLGPDKDVVATWQRLYGLEFGIESSWVGLALTYGLLLTSLILIGLAAFARSLIRTCGRGAGALFLFFFVSVSATASLSGKTTSFAMAVALALLFLRKDERRSSVLGFPFEIGTLK